MADDAPEFNPPLGDWAPTVMPASVDELVEILISLLRDPEDDDLVIDGGSGRRAGAPWFAIVWVQLGERKAFMAPSTARRTANEIAADRTFPFIFGGRGALAARLTEAADQAERLAAEANRKELH